MIFSPTPNGLQQADGKWGSACRKERAPFNSLLEKAVEPCIISSSMRFCPPAVGGQKRKCRGWPPRPFLDSSCARWSKGPLRRGPSRSFRCWRSGLRLPWNIVRQCPCDGGDPSLQSPEAPPPNCGDQNLNRQRVNEFVCRVMSSCIGKVTQWALTPLPI